MFGIADVAPSGKLVALLPVLAPALAIRLSDDGAVAAFRFADTPRCEDEVDGAERVLYAVRVVLDSACMEQEAALRCPPPFGRLPNRPFGHAGDVRAFGRRPLPAILRYLIEPDRVRVDEIVIEPVVLNHQIQHASKESG